MSDILDEVFIENWTFYPNPEDDDNDGLERGDEPQPYPEKESDHVCSTDL